MEEIINKRVKQTLNNMLTNEMKKGVSFVLRERVEEGKKIYGLYITKERVENVFVKYHCEAKLLDFYNLTDDIPKMKVNKEYKIEELNL